MATRAAFTFTDEHDTHHVYKHFDGYPKGAARAIARTFSLAWEPPRFESDEFGAAFIAANKDRPGGLRLTDHWRDHVDLQYRYEIFREEKTLHVRALAVTCSYPKNLWESREIFSGPLCQFIEEHTQADEDTPHREMVAQVSEPSSASYSPVAQRT